MTDLSTATSETWRDVVARHLEALPEDRPISLAEFVAGVEAELDDYWPASPSFDAAAWDRAKARFDAAQLADLAQMAPGEVVEVYGS